MDYHMIVYYCI